MSHNKEAKSKPWSCKMNEEQDVRFNNLVENIGLSKSEFMMWAMETLYSHLNFKFNDDFKAIKYFMAGFMGEISYRYESGDVQKTMLDIKNKLTQRR